jgi:hypothetical protein
MDLSQTAIFLTTKLGGGEITELMQGGMGFVQPKDKPTAGLDEKSVRQPCDAAFTISNPAAIAIWWRHCSDAAVSRGYGHVATRQGAFQASRSTCRDNCGAVRNEGRRRKELPAWDQAR